MKVEKFEVSKDYGLCDQIRRATVSVMSNLAEGFERGSSSEFHQFIVIAKASCAEVRSQLYVAHDVGYITQHQFDYTTLLKSERELSRRNNMKQITVELINEITKRIIESLHPEKIILFGSHVWGKPGEYSDIDLFIIIPSSDQPSYRRAREVYRCLRGIGVPIDVIVQTHEEVEHRKNVMTSLTRRVLRQGKVLYG